MQSIAGPDQGKTIAPQPIRGRFEHRQRRRRRNRRINRIAAGLQHLHPGLRRQRMAARHHAALGHDRHSPSGVGKWCRLRSMKPLLHITEALKVRYLIIQ